MNQQQNLVTPEQPKAKLWLWVTLVIVVLAAAGFFYWTYYMKDDSGSTTATTTKTTTKTDDYTQVDNDLKGLESDLEKLDSINSSDDVEPSL